MSFLLDKITQGNLRTFVCNLILVFIFSFNFLTGLRAQTAKLKVDLTLNAPNYTLCDTLLTQVQVSREKDFTNIVDQSDWIKCQAGQNLTYSAYIPLVQGSFYWRGRHKDPCAGNVSNWSQTFRFYLLLDPKKIILGDVNGDSLLSVSDIVYLTNYFFKSGPPPTPPQAGDSNCDNKCSVSDLIFMINYLFKSGLPPCKPKIKPRD